MRGVAARGWSGRLAAAAGPRAEVSGGRSRRAREVQEASAGASGSQERVRRGLRRGRARGRAAPERGRRGRAQPGRRGAARLGRDPGAGGAQRGAQRWSSSTGRVRRARDGLGTGKWCGIRRWSDGSGRVVGGSGWRWRVGLAAAASEAMQERLRAPFLGWCGQNAALAVVAAADTRCGNGEPSSSRFWSREKFWNGSGTGGA
jgi:hypothetical protein